MTKRMTHEEFVERVAVLTGSEYTVVGVYTLTHVKLDMQHNACGNIWSIAPNKFITGVRCPKCMALRKTKTTNTFIQEIKGIFGDDLTIIGEYVGCETSIEVRCNKHDVTFHPTPTTLLRGRISCRQCYNEKLSLSQRKDDKDVDKALFDKHHGSIVREGAYVNTHTKIDFRCLECDKVFNSEPNSVLRISGCPYCNTSKGESIIKRELDNLGVTYIHQQSFEGCTYVRPLYYDFYLPKENTLIEYDGVQHYKPIDFFGGEVAFRSQKSRDEIKNNYAKDNNIKLIRIPYTKTEEQITSIVRNLVRVVPQ